MAACRRAPAHPYITYFNADNALSLRYPSNWTTQEADQGGTWYRYFLAPPAGEQRKSAVSVTLLAGPLAGSLDAHAQSYLAGNSVLSSRDATRQGAAGKAWRFAAPDGATRYSLLLLQEQQRVYGLYGQGDAARFEEHAPVLDEIEASLTLERPAHYPEHRNDKLAFSLRVPSSWPLNRSFSGGSTYLMQFTSPVLGVDRRQVLHGSLTLTVEPSPGDGSLDAFYKAIRNRLGEPFRVLSHASWNDGYVDQERTETPVTVSRLKRFYRVHQGRGYSLVFEARDDVFHRASRWCDIIAATLKIGPEVTQP